MDTSMKDFVEWCLQEFIENFEYDLHEYEQLDFDFDYDSED